MIRIDVRASRSLTSQNYYEDITGVLAVFGFVHASVRRLIYLRIEYFLDLRSPCCANPRILLSTVVILPIISELKIYGFLLLKTINVNSAFEPEINL